MDCVKFIRKIPIPLGQGNVRLIDIRPQKCAKYETDTHDTNRSYPTRKELTHHIDRRHPDLKVAVHHHRGEQGQV